MNEQPGDVLDEAAKLFDALRRRMGGGGTGGGTGADAGDVWGRATAEDPHIATGAPECRNCPICRAIAIQRESGADVGRHVREAGQSLLAAALDVVAAFDRTRGSRPPEASPGPRTGTSERSGRSPRDGRPERPEPGDAWSAATGGSIDIG
ncbi:hypothetical protein [Actinomadura rubrisoli]|uniref:Uncharacterized protein n=1 Tax=Actinomadura rubrisoli TaxID=2530368 RepID=A0A4R5APY4_9ACTN|nr:hypothetical protein [Actinomadura rubrisoli]TDD73696.1 hypothetical protein E1298_33470 [Actinomadura rubrisoli]